MTEPSSAAMEPEKIAWESTTPVYRKYISDRLYQKMDPGFRKWYRPYRCASCSDAIKTLTRERDEAREALKEISKQPYYSLPLDEPAIGSLFIRYNHVISIADKAVAALKPEEPTT